MIEILFVGEDSIFVCMHEVNAFFAELEEIHNICYEL